MSLLVCLAEHAGAVVTKEVLLETVWADTFVSEQVLKVTVSELRKALNDSARNPRYINTISKKGYQLIAPVHYANGNLQTVEFRGETKPIGEQAANRSWIGPVIAISLIIVGAITIGAFAFFGTRPPITSSGPIKSIAVLPLQNVSSDGTADFFADGLTEAINNDLAGLSALRVISPRSSMQYKSSAKSPAQISRELNVEALLEGSVLRSGERVRLTVRLISANGENLWAKTYERDFRDVLAIQAELSSDIARRVKLKIIPSATKPQVNSEAYEAYLKGRYFWNKRNIQNIERSLDYFQQAVAIDPNQALFHSGLADAYTLLAFYRHEGDGENYEKAKAAARRALFLDENLAEARTSLAAVLHKHDLDLSGAGREFQKALDLNPNYATAHQWYAIYLISIGEYERAVAEIDNALELDPLSLVMRTDRGWILYVCRRYEESIAQLRQVIELESRFAAHYFLILAYAKHGMHNEAIAEAKLATSRYDGPEFISLLAYAQAVAGSRGEAAVTLKKLKQLPAAKLPIYETALAYIALDEKSKALELLERVPQESSSWQAFLGTQPELDPLRSDPRFQALLPRLSL